MLVTSTLAAISVSWLFTPWGLGAILAVVLLFDSEVPSRIVRAVKQRPVRLDTRRIPAIRPGAVAAESRTGVSTH
jgi:hypothetical protein